MPMVKAGRSITGETLERWDDILRPVGRIRRLAHNYAGFMDLALGDDDRWRCAWGTSTPDYLEYHDSEWGIPVSDDRLLFEKLCLEGFQSGLSWLTILRKRPAFREAFSDFEIEKVAAMTPDDVERLMAEPRIVRHRGKIESTINNATRLVELRQEFGSFAAFVWGYEPESSDPSDSQSAESVAFSQALKKRGFTWTGPTTAYAFMQAMGLVNDHQEGCFTRAMAADLRRSFRVPERDGA